MGTRVELRTKLEALNIKLYFQSPGKELMEFPCLVYSRTRPSNEQANNEIYCRHMQYELVYITALADDPMSDILENYLPYCTKTSERVIENRYHHYYTLYF